MTHCTGTLAMGHAEVHRRQGPLHTLGNTSELPSSAPVHARENTGSTRTSESLHPSKTAVPPSVLAMCSWDSWEQGTLSFCRYTDVPRPVTCKYENCKAQGLKAHQCSSLKSHCCEFLSHPRKVPTALPKWWLSPPKNLCHPLEFSSGCACPCLQRCISWYNRSWPDIIQAFLLNFTPLCGKCLYLCHSTDLLYWSFLLAIALELKLTGEHLLLLSLSSGADCGNISPCLQLVPGREGSFCQAYLCYLSRLVWVFSQRICEILSEWSKAQACDSRSLESKLFKKH